MKKIKDKLQARAKFNKGKRVGYAEGRPVVDRETGEIIPVLTPGMTSGRKVQQSKFEPVTVQTTAPVKATATTPTTLSVGTPTPAPVQAPSRTSSPAPVLPEEKIETNYSPNQKTSKDFRENLAVKDTKDYASMSDDEIRKLIPQISYGGPGNKKTVDIGQAQIDEFRLQKTNPGLLFEMVQKGADISPNDYNDPTAKKVAERLLNQRLAMEKAVQDAASNKPTPKPAPDGTPENPFQMQPTPTPAPTPAPAVPGETPEETQARLDNDEAIRIRALDDKKKQDEFEAERRARLIETGLSAQDMAAGIIPEGAIPQAEVVSVPTGPDYESEAILLAERKGVTPEYVKQVGLENVSKMEDISTASTPTALETSTITAEQIAKGDLPSVDAAQTTVDDLALAKAAGVDRVSPIEAATVEIIDGALTDRVIGVISEDAKATAVKNVGSSLARITRAKKQLSKAGLSDADIAELANDPEALEARLADFSEAERGIIEGLPEEALVSNQIDGLLKGIEEGEIPIWARPAVASVEAMLAQRGMSASTVGRDALFNAIIQSAMPIAQSNAQAIQASVAQQKGIEAQESEANAARGQQTALTNASNVFQMDMAQFSSDQQIALSNSKFLQTVGLTEANNRQQATIQNAVLMSQANLAEADFYQKAQIQNAQAFLQTDLSNLNNRQQAVVLQAQNEQQRLLSNQSAVNVAKQFNAASENQTQQFMANLNSQVEQFNAQQLNVASQFNVQQENAAEGRRIQNQVEINKANAAIVNQTKQFNEEIDFRRDSFNAQNAQAIEQSNITWRRNANLADTAAQNESNRMNAQNAFSLSSTAQSFLWQELRDQADYDFRWADSSANRKVQAMIASASAEGNVAKNWTTNFNSVATVVDNIFGGG